MGYLESIKTAIIVFPIIAFLFTIPFILHQYHKYGSINKFRVLIIYSFILYLITMYFLVILPLPSREEVANMTGRTIQLIPFSFIGDIARETNFNILDPSTYLSKTLLNLETKISFSFIGDIARETNFNVLDPSTYISTLSHPSAYTMLFNVVMTIPFGMYLRYYYKCSLKKTFILTLLLSLFFEFTQVTGLYGIYPRPYRLCDVDDLITNTLGGIIGYFIMGIVDDFLPTRDEIDEETIEDGKRVSGFRRITLFFLDGFVYLCLSTILSLFSGTLFMTLISFIIYYGVIPSFWNGKTIASNFLNVRVTFPNMTFIRLILKTIFNYLYYFMLPVCILATGMIIVNNIDLSAVPSIWVYLGCFIIIILFYLVNIFLLLKNGRIYYDKAFKITYLSTIDEVKEKDRRRKDGKH